MFDINVFNFQYSYVYVAINIFCVLVSLLFLAKFSFRVGNSREIQLFRAMTIFFLIYLILEIIWVLGLVDVLPLSPLAEGLIKVAGTMFVPFMVFFWFWFAEERFRSEVAKTLTFRIVLSIPIILMCVLYATSFYTGLVFRISPQRTVQPGPLCLLTGIIDNFYGIAIIIHAVILYIKEKNRFQRRDCRMQIMFIIICTIAGILDAVVRMTPVMTLTISFSFIYLLFWLSERKKRWK